MKSIYSQLKLFKVLLVFLVFSCQGVELDEVPQETSSDAAVVKLRASAILSSNEFRVFENAMFKVVKTLSTERRKNSFLEGRISYFQNSLAEAKVKNSENLLKIFDDFKISEETKRVLLQQAEIMEEQLKSIEKKYLTGLNTSDKETILKYLNFNHDNRNAKLLGCCTTYRDALIKCLKDAGYDWLWLQWYGISALWHGILMYMSAKDCIDRAEAKYADCCESEAPAE